MLRGSSCSSKLTLLLACYWSSLAKPSCCGSGTFNQPTRVRHGSIQLDIPARFLLYLLRFLAKCSPVLSGVISFD
ncbi:hypothetical protein JTE90_024318 [Oedothorax gibbosus]|uniref:Secreted protein n=1 Tax=Oedothorax gibbosus TaxID=931172 RepID=A0AAV6VZ88_9ARAC|nr:hypothetical protein JTE90_024318 [Oedothorax gibbosus]